MGEDVFREATIFHVPTYPLPMSANLGQSEFLRRNRLEINRKPPLVFSV